MAFEHIGALVTVECADESSYQGIISSVDPNAQTITLRNPFKDGVRLDDFELVIR